MYLKEGTYHTRLFGAAGSAACGCNAGYMREEEGLKCVACRVGFFRAAGDVDEECSQCASGLSTLFTGSNSSDMCVACLAGSFLSQNGECMLCPENASSVTGGVCECDAGYSGELFTTTGVCSVCAKGFFKALHGNHACALCPAGTEGSGVQAPVHMNESCIDCAAGTFWLSEQTECQACVNNSFSVARAVGNCTCNAGYFASADIELQRMRVCGTCRFGCFGQSAGSAAHGVGVAGAAVEQLPFAALVLFFCRTQFDGRQGIIAAIESMCEQKHMPMAAAYCSVCRRCTWLCREDADINVACAEFLHQWRASEQILAGMSLLQGRARSPHVSTSCFVSTSCLGSETRAAQSTGSTCRKRKF